MWKYLPNTRAVKQKSSDTTGDNKDQFQFNLHRSYTKYVITQRLEIHLQGTWNCVHILAQLAAKIAYDRCYLNT
jgi:hypothetical protein